MTKFYPFLTVLFLCGAITSSVAGDEDFVDPLRAASASAITAYSSSLSNAPAALARTYIMGSTGTKGIIGESLASKSFLQASLQKTGNWHSISPRIGPNGIDHIFLKIDPKTALPRDIIVGESKYNTSLLGKTIDGLQLTKHWVNRRLCAMGTRYFQLSQVTAIQKVPLLGGQHEMTVVLKSGKEVCFWRASSQDTWKFSGTQRELHEAQRLAKVYGQYLYAAGKGEILYRSRLFQIVPRGNDIVIIIKDASQLEMLQSAKKLPITQKITLHNVLKEKLPQSVEREIAKSLKGKFPGYSEKELAKLARAINTNARDVLTPYGKVQMLGTFAAQAGVASLIAVAADAGIQYFATGDINAEKLLFTGGTVFAGTLGAQYLEVGLTQWSVTQGLFKGLGHTLGCSSSLLSGAFSSASGGFLIGTLLAYGSWYMGYTDLTTANRMAVASGVGAGLGMLAGWGTFAAISAWGTASTGTAIATLSGAAATNASLAFLGGSVAMGTVVSAGIIGVAALVGTVAVMKIYECIDEEKELERIAKLCEYFSEPTVMDKLMEKADDRIYSAY